MYKYLSTAVFFVLIFVSCSKKEANLELFSPEAFCYSLEPGYELNSTVNVKGFEQKENNKKYYAKVSYSVDLSDSSKVLKKDIFNNVIEKESSETIMDIQLECQIELDSTYSGGEYIITYYVKDELSGKTSKINKNFKVE